MAATALHTHHPEVRMINATVTEKNHFGFRESDHLEPERSSLSAVVRRVASKMALASLQPGA
jgi:hypothetical protein